MHRGARKTTPRVKDGRVHLKNPRDVRFVADGPFGIAVRVPRRGFRHVVTPEQIQAVFASIPEWEVVSRGLRRVVLADGSDECESWYRGGVIGLHAWRDPIAHVVSAQHFLAHQAIWERFGVPWRPEPELIGVVDLADPFKTKMAVRSLLWDTFDSFDWVIEGDDASEEWVAIDESEKPARYHVCDLVIIDYAVHVYHRRVLAQFDRHTAAAYTLLHLLLRELGRHVDRMGLPVRAQIGRGEPLAGGWAARTAEAIRDATLAMLRATP